MCKISQLKYAEISVDDNGGDSDDNKSIFFKCLITGEVGETNSNQK